MPFSSFSTSILYGGHGVSSVQQAAQTADVDRGNYSDIPCHSDSQDCSRFPHYLHELVNRDVKPDNKTAVTGGSVNDTKTGNSTLAKPPKSPATQWSTDKASIAASTLFAAFATTAFIFMIVLCVKRYRKRRRRKKMGNADLIAAEEKKRKRESQMFCRNQPRTYVIEQDRNGEVTRVLCTGNRSPGAGSPLESVSSIQPDMRIEATRHLAEICNTNSGRSGSIPQPVVIVSPPLEPVVSRVAVPSTQATETTESIDQDQRTGSSKSSETTVSPILEPTESKQSNTDSSTSSGTRRMSLFRLPPIRQSMSPLFQF